MTDIKLESPAARAGTITLGDLTVNRLGFGAMRVTGDGIWGDPADDKVAEKVLKRAVELGCNFIDTADAYGPEVSENLIAAALKPYDGIVIATKGGQVRPGPNQWVPDGRPEHLREACEGSLKRLGVDTIDVYQLHRPDPKVPFEDSVQALADLQKEGKIKHIGLSNITVKQLETARQIVPIVSVQNHYNIELRQDEDVLKACEDAHIAFLPWGPLSSGGDMSEHAKTLLTSIASLYHATVNQVILAWLLQHSPVMLPIPGTGSLEHLEENVMAATIELSQEDVRALDELGR